MKNKFLIRFFGLSLAAGVGLAFISYHHKASASSQECTTEKCEQKKAQTDFIILESLSKHLLSSTEN
ncbi:MAG TPA: hypothetical protein VMT76_00390 [Puia sp.]|nr:hypothetical protein [Puia sp.]